MKLFGERGLNGEGHLLRQVALAGGVVVVVAVIATSWLDKTARNGFAGLMRDPLMANLPRPAQPAAGIRYGSVDYMPTGSIPANQQKFKNTVSDPSLGMLE